MNWRKVLKGSIALTVGCLINYFGDRLLGVEIELFWGISTFGFLWIVDMFFLPFVVGLAVGMVYGMGGKWLCYFPPLIVRIYSYMQYNDINSIPDGASLLPLGWWGFFVIVVMEAAAFGGIAGEIVVKRTYGRRPKHLVFKSKETPPLEDIDVKNSFK